MPSLLTEYPASLIADISPKKLFQEKVNGWNYTLLLCQEWGKKPIFSLEHSFLTARLCRHQWHLLLFTFSNQDLIKCGPRPPFSSSYQIPQLVKPPLLPSKVLPGKGRNYRKKLMCFHPRTGRKRKYPQKEHITKSELFTCINMIN